jgi:hypothetical protein
VPTRPLPPSLAELGGFPNVDGGDAEGSSPSHAAAPEPQPTSAAPAAPVLAISPSTSLTLQQAVDMGWDRYTAAIAAVSSRAVREHNIEAALDQMQECVRGGGACCVLGRMGLPHSPTPTLHYLD